VTTFTELVLAWVAVTIIFLAFVIYRSRLTKQETDWIPLTDDAKEDRAIQTQTIIEKKTRKLNIPIKALGALSVVMLLVVLGLWLYEGIFLPPPVPK